MSAVEQTIALLGQIPTLAAELPGFLTGAGAEPESRTAGPAASRPPLDLAILDLVDGRQLEWWVLLAIDEMFEAGIEPDDPPSSRRRSIDADCRWLAQNCEWIADHNDDFHTDIRRIHGAYQHAAGHTAGPKILCPKCGNRAFIDGQWMICSEVENHARTIRDIEHELRYQPAETTDQITRRFAITPDRLWQWRHRRKLAPARKDGRTLLWWPWDVFCLLNPQVAEAIAARDEARTA